MAANPKAIDNKESVTAKSTKTSLTWVLVADGRKAQIYKRTISKKRIPIGGDSGQTRYREAIVRELTPIENMAWEAQSEAEYEKGRNKTGMVFESASSARHMSEPHLYIREIIKQNFAKHIATELNEASKNRKFSSLILVAPARMLGEIRKTLSDNVQEKVRIEFPKDLTSYEGKDLIKHLKNVI